ncbi:hypothetical protein IWW34DRAFT_711205 [Fusarium oxysporum f. sp. albedinis]|nr:hypothetical protein IWW34DRAFT_711205 [Fusarium oxysporum f. sp. albedinis]
MALVMRQSGVNDDRIPGLQVPLTFHDLRQGRKYHNELSYGNKDQDQDQDDQRHRESLRQLLEKFDVQDIFGLVDKHKHFDLPDDSHLIGTVGTFGVHPQSLFYLIRTVADKTSNPNELCGHKFTYIPGKGLRPYEFHQGPLLDDSKVKPEFFSQFINYLNKYNITSIGLEYVIPQVSQIAMHEICSEEKRWMILIEGKLPLDLPNPKQRAVIFWRLFQRARTFWRLFERAVTFWRMFRRAVTCRRPTQRAVTSWRWPKSKSIYGPASDCDKDPDGTHVGPDDLPAGIYRMLDQMCLI